MVGRYQAYPEYKDSGVVWLGEVPEHWAITKIAWHFGAEKGKKGQLLTKEYCGANSGQYPVYSGQTENQGIMGRIDDFEFDTGGEGVLFSTTVGAKAMHLSHLVGKFSLSQNCMIIIPKTKAYSTRFSYYHFQPLFLFERGLIPDHMQASFRMEDLYQYKLAFPAYEEQIQIANFLDHETSKIDTLIEKQQQLIKLLGEKRQAVISHAVTKGLNLDAPMKDSGVEWLGEVPEHWEVGKVKWIVEMAGRIGYRGYTVDDIVDEGEGAIVLSPANINERGFNLNKRVFLSWAKYFESPEIMLEPGDVMLVKTSWSFGKVAVVSEVSSPMTINPQMVLLKKSKIDSRFVSYFLNTDALQSRIFTINTGSYMPTMTQENIGELPMFIPPKDEATDVVNYIQKECIKFNALLDKQESVVELLQERRIALISAAVTGKIDVRNWQAPKTTPHKKESTKDIQ